MSRVRAYLSECLLWAVRKTRLEIPIPPRPPPSARQYCTQHQKQRDQGHNSFLQQAWGRRGFAMHELWVDLTQHVAELIKKLKNIRVRASVQGIVQRHTVIDIPSTRGRNRRRRDRGTCRRVRTDETEPEHCGDVRACVAVVRQIVRHHPLNNLSVFYRL